MNLILTSPLGLLALGGLLLPLLLHLVRRNTPDILDFAALRWLRAGSQPRRRLRLEQLWLLLLRLLLVALAALLVAGPLLEGRLGGARSWILVDSALTLDQARRVDAGVNAEWRWLAPGFPQVADAAVPASDIPRASLLREFDAGLGDGDQVRVILPRSIEPPDAERLQLAHRIDWHIVTDAEDGAALPATTALRIGVPEGAAVPAPIQAALEAWAAQSGWTLQPVPNDAAPADLDWLVRNDAELSAAQWDWIRAGGRALQIGSVAGQGEVLAHDADGTPAVWLEAIGQGRRVQMQGPLNAARLPWLLDADFPQRLRGWMEGAPKPTSVLSASIAPSVGKAAPLPPRRSIDAWLALAIGVLWLLERWFAQRHGATS